MITAEPEQLPESEQRFLPVVCTDRGQHGPAMITTAYRKWRGESGGMSHALRWWAPPDVAGEFGGHTSTDSYEFRCPACPRVLQIRRDRWWRIVEEAWRVGLPSLDLSHIQ